MQLKSLALAFTLVRPGRLFFAKAAGQPVMDCRFQDGTLDFSLLFDFLEKPPLHLTAPGKIGDSIMILVHPHRMELYVNGTLLDEEWPCGGHFLGKAQIEDQGSGLKIAPAVETAAAEPAILDSFQNAEGWRPEENVFVGDCMPYTYNDEYHVLYLKDRHHHKSKWTLGAHQWSHISTSDFKTWQIHPMAVPIDDPNEGSICTGSWMVCNGMHYLFYTVRTCDGSAAPIRRSVSEDGYHFRKDPDFGFTLSEKYTGASARDPKVIAGADGKFHMILTTSLSGGCGCLAHLVSDDLNVWQELPDPIYVAAADMWEPECPDYFYKDGYYYLVFSLHGKGHYLYSQDPFTGWQLPKEPIIPCKRVPKAAIWRNRLIFTGFDPIGDYAGNLTFTEARVTPGGELEFLK